MHRFNRALAGLYQLAEQASHNEFPVEALKLLQPWINFDGAVFWMGEIGMNESDSAIIAGLLIAHVHVHSRDAILSDDAQISALDLAIQAFLGGLNSPLQLDCSTLEQNNANGLEEFVRRHALQHVLLFGESASPDKQGRWLVLYRAENIPFNGTESSYLHASWFHLAQALDINRFRMLDRHDPRRTQRALALINACGFIMVADAYFHRLLCREWPECRPKRLPQEALDELKRGSGVYRGRHIEIVMNEQPGYITCLAREIDARTKLTPCEYMVARRYANGLSHKTIARELGVSPHTVRNQIAHLYDKLGVHDKAALAQHFALRTVPTQ